MKVDKDIGKLLMEAIDTMDCKYGGILTGYYYNQMSIQEIADISRTKPGEIYRILCEVREILKDYLREKGLEEKDFPPPLSLCTELFLSFGEEAVHTAENIDMKG